jgi:hypothetical protein
MANVCESVNIFIRVHKPGRFADWHKKNNWYEYGYTVVENNLLCKPQ